MCLGIPGRIIAITDHRRKLAKVEVSGVRREVNVTCVAGGTQTLDELLGAWVLVHVGFAMSRIDEQEAQRTLELLAELGAVREQHDASADPGRR